MSIGPANDAKERVRQAVDIVDLVGSYIQLRRQGRNYVGICPWHDDSRPSLQVNSERQSFKCWVCDIGGDVFSFVMKMENVEFREALELLADRAGISLQTIGHGHSQSPSQGEPTSEKKTQLLLMAWAETQFHRCLLEAPEAEPGRAYLADRKISPECIRRFHLGFAPNRWDWLLERTRGTEWSPKLLERAGLLRRKDTGDGFYDWFRGRVMFSIRDGRGRPIAFGGRVLPQLADERAAKYINSPETLLFSKSRELYGLDVARDAIAKSNHAIVMEGYTDCLMAQQHGIENVVAVLGTALGERHVKLLQQNRADSITLVLDGDDAGRRRTNEIIDSLLALFAKNQVDLRILTLPEGVDPCDFIATHGSDAFRHLLAGAVDALEHKFRSVTQGLDISTDTHRASQAVEQVLATLAHIRGAAAVEASSPLMLREQQMLGRIARRFRLPEEQLRERLIAIRRGRQSRPVAVNLDSASAPNAPHHSVSLPAWDRGVLELILLDPGHLTRIEDVIEPGDFESHVARRIYAACSELFHDGRPVDFANLSLEFDDPAIMNILVELDEAGQAKTAADREQWLQDLLTSAARRRDEHARHSSLGVATEHDAEAQLTRFFEQSRVKQLGQYERRKK